MSLMFFQSFVITYHLIQNFLGMVLIAYQTKSRSYFTYSIILMGSIVAALTVFASSYLFCKPEECLFSYTTLSVLSLLISYFVQLLLWHWWFSKSYKYAWLLLLISHIGAYVVCYLIFNFGTVLVWLFG